MKTNKTIFNIEGLNKSVRPATLNLDSVNQLNDEDAIK